MNIFAPLNKPMKYPYTNDELRVDNPNVSFPEVIDYSTLSHFNVYPVQQTPLPEHNASTHRCVEGIPEELDGDWVQTWAIVALTEDQIAAEAQLRRNVAKSARTAAIENITVTTSAGNTFDGDEASQTRMTRAILSLQHRRPEDMSTVNWVLADNSVIEASLAELTEALILAGSAQASLWVLHP